MTASLEIVSEQLKHLSSGLGELKSDMQKMNDQLVPLTEFKKDVSYLNERVTKVESSRNKILEEVRQLQLSVTSQKTLNKILQTILGIAATAALSIGIFMAGSSRTLETQINGMERDLYILKDRASRNSTVPRIEVNTSGNEKKD